jgi:hypothetical protein
MSKNRKTVQSSNANLFIVVIFVAAMLLIAALVVNGYISIQGPSQGLSTYVIARVAHTDGTVSAYTLYPSPVALTMIDTGGGGGGTSGTSPTPKAATSVEFDMYATPTFTGTVQSWTISGTYCFGLSEGQSITTVGQLLWKSQSYNLGQFGAGLGSGVATEVAAFNSTTAYIQSIYNGWQPNINYYWFTQFNGPVSMTLTFSDGSTATLSASVSTVSWEFNYASPATFTSLSFSWQ